MTIQAMKRAVRNQVGGSSTLQLAGAKLSSAPGGLSPLTHTDIVHIPYKGGGPALTAVLSGVSDLSFLGVVPATQHVRTGRMRALGITSLKPSPDLPGVPTIAEAGVPGYEFSSWYGIWAPAGTPADVVTVLNGHVVKATRSPDVAKRLAAQGVEIVASSPPQFAAHVKNELARWAKVVKEAGLHAD